MIRSLAFSAALAAIATTVALAQPPAPRSRLASEMPMPKAGTTIMLSRSEVKSKKDDDGLQEVSEVVAAKEEKMVTIPTSTWEIDADGWFDSEGFNVTKAFPRSGLWAMRTAKGNRPGTAGSGLSTSASQTLQAQPRLYRAGPNDVITHIDGIAVTTYERYIFALNSAANPRDIPIVVLNSQTSRRHVFYITAFKVSGN